MDGLSAVSGGRSWKVYGGVSPEILRGWHGSGAFCCCASFVEKYHDRSREKLIR